MPARMPAAWPVAPTGWEAGIPCRRTCHPVGYPAPSPKAVEPRNTSPENGTRPMSRPKAKQKSKEK